MRTSDALGHVRRMLFVVEVDRDESGRVVGSVTSAPGDTSPFEGWLQLLRLLERTALTTTPGEEP